MGLPTLPQRLELLGIDAEYVRQAMPTTFPRPCPCLRSLPGVRRYRRDLARGDAQVGLESYCLNALTIDVLTVSRTIASPRYDQEDGMQWWMTRRVERQARRMHEMMNRLNVDRAALVRARQGQDYARGENPLPDLRDQRQMPQMAGQATAVRRCAGVLS